MAGSGQRAVPRWRHHRLRSEGDRRPVADPRTEDQGRGAGRCRLAGRARALDHRAGGQSAACAARWPRQPAGSDGGGRGSVAFRRRLPWLLDEPHDHARRCADHDRRGAARHRTGARSGRRAQPAAHPFQHSPRGARPDAAGLAALVRGDAPSRCAGAWCARAILGGGVRAAAVARHPARAQAIGTLAVAGRPAAPGMGAGRTRGAGWGRSTCCCTSSWSACCCG